MKYFLTSALVWIGASGLASAGERELANCYEDAAYQFIAYSAGTDVSVARQMAAIMPEGQTMVRNIRSMSVVTYETYESGIAPDMLAVVVRGTVADQPYLGTLISACIMRHL